MDDGWHSWEFCPPPSNSLVIIRSWGDVRVTIFPKDLPSDFNISGLEWTFTGIEKEKYPPDGNPPQWIPQNFYSIPISSSLLGIGSNAMGIVGLGSWWT